jgi:hypothetical protein
MPHTNPWNVTDPPGSEQAKNIDDHIRKLRVDIGDRLADLVVDVMADPLVIKRSALEEPVGGTIKMISMMDFKTSTTGKEAIYLPGVLMAFTDTDGLYADVELPAGAVVTKIEVLADAGDATNVTWTFWRRQFAASGVRPSSQSAQDPQGSFSTTPGSGVKIIASGVMTVTIDQNYVYYLGVEGNGPAGKSFDLFGARITYTPP